MRISSERGGKDSRWVWTKRGVCRGLSYCPPYGLPLINFVKTRLSIAINRRKQRAPSV